MEKYTNVLKCEEIKRLVSLNKYDKALKILHTLDTNKIRNLSDLMMFVEVYDKSKNYNDAIRILYRIYSKSTSRRVVYQLAKIHLKAGNLEEAEQFYEEFSVVAPRDSNKYILRYHIDKAKGQDIKLLITSLEKLKESEYSEEWAYELAKLYHKAGLKEKCVKECSDIILFFGDGIIVEKCKLLKAYYSGNTEAFDDIRLRDHVAKELELYNTIDISKVVKEASNLAKKSAQALEDEKNPDKTRESAKGSLTKHSDTTNELKSMDKVKTDSFLEEIQKNIARSLSEDFGDRITAGQEVSSDSRYDDESVESVSVSDYIRNAEGALIAADGDTFKDNGIIRKSETETERNIGEQVEEIKSESSTAEPQNPEAAVQINMESDISQEIEDIESRTMESVTVEGMDVELEEGFTQPISRTEKKKKGIKDTKLFQALNNAAVRESLFQKTTNKQTPVIPQEQLPSGSEIQSESDIQTNKLQNDVSEDNGITDVPISETNIGVIYETELTEQEPATQMKEENRTAEEPVTQMKEENRTAEEPVTQMKKENRTAEEPVIQMKEENRTAEEPVIQMKEEDRTAEEPVIHVREEDRTAEEPVIHIKEENRTSEAPVTLEREEDTTVGEPAIQMQKERMEPQEHISASKNLIFDEINIEPIYQNFVNIKELRQQLYDIFEGISLKKNLNFLICGESCTGKTMLAKMTARALFKLNHLSSSKIARITAMGLNGMDLSKKREQLADSCVIIEHAGDLSRVTIGSVIEMMEYFNGSVSIILEDEESKINELLINNPVLTVYFKNKIIMPIYDVNVLRGFAENYFKELDYEISSNAMEIIKDMAAQITEQVNEGDRLAALIHIMMQAKENADRRNGLRLKEVVLANNYGKEPLNVIEVSDLLN